MMVQHVLIRFAQNTIAIGALCLMLDSAHAIDLRKDLSEAQFKAAGLTKLETAELDELQRILDTKLVPSVEPAASLEIVEQMPAKPTSAASENSPNWRPAPVDSERKTIETEVTDSFSGLFGATKITLANGQVWQQTDRSQFDLRLHNKRVRIKPGVFGRWRIQFLENNLSFPVKRVK